MKAKGNKNWNQNKNKLKEETKTNEENNKQNNKKRPWRVAFQDQEELETKEGGTEDE